MSGLSLNLKAQQAPCTIVPIKDGVDFKTLEVNGVKSITFRIQQIRMSFNGGFTNRSNRNAFQTIPEEFFKQLGLGIGTVLAGQIIRRESNVPFYTKKDGTPQDCKRYPSNYDRDPSLAGQPILVAGKKVYFDDSFTEDMTMLEYKFIEHTEEVFTSEDSQNINDEAGF